MSKGLLLTLYFIKLPTTPIDSVMIGREPPTLATAGTPVLSVPTSVRGPA